LGDHETMSDSMSAMHNPEMTREEALRLYGNGWWKLYPAREVALAQLQQERLCMPFDDFQHVVEEAIGGPVWTHEFARPQALVERIRSGQSGPVDPFRSLADVILRRTRSGMYVTRGRRYRTKALALRSRVIAVAI
jgi:hypothetical protein